MEGSYHASIARSVTKGRQASPMIGVRLGHSAMSARCPVCPKADTTGRLMSTLPSLTPLADLGRSPWQAPLHRLHAAGKFEACVGGSVVCPNAARLLRIR